MRSGKLTVRTVALLGAGSAAIHQLRYAIGYGDAAPHALALHDHAYLDVVLPGLLTMLLIATAALLMRLAAGADARGGADARALTGALRASRVPARLSLGVLWLACAVALAVIFGVQETAEGAGALAGGGWIGLALAIPAGLLVALGIRGTDAAAELRSATLHLRAFVLHATPLNTPLSAPHVAAPTSGLGARAPPQASVA